ncbi:hypothetical protein G15_3608 [Enterococcus avium]|nr:hypothetical protein G15_3608 [Enterococcus avium]
MDRDGLSADDHDGREQREFPNAGGASQISSICDGANPLTWALVRLNGLGYIGTGVGAFVAAAMAIWNRNRIKKEASQLHDGGEAA